MSVPKKVQKHFFVAMICIGLFFVLYFTVSSFFSDNYSAVYNVSQKNTGTLPALIVPEKKVTHIATPEPLKAIYMTQCVVGTKPFRESLVKIADETEVNSIIIDIKDYTGRLAFDVKDPKLSPSISPTCGASDMVEFVEYLHSKNIYVIGRLAVFQDPFFAKLRPDLAVQSRSTGLPWKDFKGLGFIDVGAKEYWNYISSIAKEAYAIGFDEVNFDYVRFPSDGKMEDTLYTHSKGRSKPEVLKEFFAYLHDELKDTGLKTSVDFFGMTTTSNDDLNIGQILENALPYFDFVAPMVYPSHYPKNFNGWANPDDYVYEVVNFAMSGAVKKANALDLLIANKNATTTATSTIAVTTPKFNPPSWYKGGSAKKLRTWIQDFDYGGNYDIAEVKAQIKASYDAGVQSWMIWSPSNKYTVGALLKN